LAFSQAIASRYLIDDFYGSFRNDQSVGVYLLTNGKEVKNFV